MSATTFYNSTNLVGIGTLNAASVSTTLANVIQANIQSMNVSGDSNLSGNLITGNIIMSSNLSTNSGQGNVYISANLVVNGNIFSIGGSVGSGSGTSQGVTYVLPSSYSLGAAFATGSAGPGIAGFHINMSLFGAQAVAAVSSFSASSGMLKFASAGLYSVQCVLVGDQPATKVGIGSTSSASFPPSVTATSGYVYVYNYPLNSSPTTLVTIPLNITDVSKWYYLDAYFSTVSGSPSVLLQTAPPSGSASGSNYGTYVQVGPFGNYLTSATGVASALLANCSTSSNLSGSYSSNAYRIALTSSNGWTVNGTSTSLAVTANGNFQVNQAGLYEVNMCLNLVGQTPVQFQVGSLSSDTATPGTSTPAYLYTYAPMYTQDPTTAIKLPLNITNTSNVYFVECSFQGTSTANIALNQTSTFVSIKPIGSYVTPATNPWLQQGTSVYYNSGPVGLGVVPTALTETLTVSGNTSFISNVTVTSDASSNNYVVAKRVPAGSLSVANYVTGSVPLTTTTSLINNYLSNAATITANTSTGSITQAYSSPGTQGSLISLGSYNSLSSWRGSTSNLFIECWVNLNLIGATNPLVYRSSGSGAYDFDLFTQSTSPYVVFNVFNSGGAVGGSNTVALSTGTWYHIACSYQALTSTTGTVRVFVNGGIGGTVGNLTTSSPTNNQTAVWIGGDGPNGAITNGKIADVRVMTGSIVPVATFTPQAAPFTTAPTYRTGMDTGYTSNLTLALNSQYFPGASTSPYGPCLTLPGTVGSYYAESGLPGTNWSATGFTLEAWVNYASFANANTFVNTQASGPATIGVWSPTASSIDWSLGAVTTGALCWYYYNGSAANAALTPAGAITTGQWTHICAQSDGTRIYLFVNGVQQTLTTQNYTNTASPNASINTGGYATSNPIAIGGGFNNGTGGYPNVAVAKARLIFGANVYSSGSFTPNPNFATSATATTWRLDSQYPLPTYPSIQDVTELPQQASSYGSLPTPVGGVTSNVVGPYTGTQLNSIRFDGTGYIDYGNAASSVMTTNLWANAWTIEGWVYPTLLTGNIPIYSRATYNSVLTAFDLLIYTQGTNLIAYAGNYVSSLSSPIQLNTWQHIAVTYDGTQSNIYVNGSYKNGGSIAPLTFSPTYGTFVGGWGPSSTGSGFSSTTSYQGNLADVRVSNVARYGGTTYVVPTAPFASNDANTLLLLKSLGGQVGTTLEVQGRGLNAVSIGTSRSSNPYPPAPMSSYLLDTTGNVAVTYGQGKYVASASSEYTGGSQFAWKAFTKNANGSYANGSWLPTDYYGGGAYQGAVTTVDVLGNSYPGGWLQIQMPVSIILSSYQLATDSGNQIRTWVILGSRDGINWTLVDSQPFTTAWTNFVQRTFTPTTTQAYNYFRLVVSNSSGNNLVLYTFVLNGTEESLCITSDSKVGVGIANPQRALEVAGDLVVSGTISGGAGMGSFRNRIINGDMRIAQRGTSNVVPNGSTQVSTYLIDRFQVFSNVATGVLTQYQTALTASDSPYQIGLRNYANLVVTSGFTASNLVSFVQVIEGYNVADLMWGTSFGSPVTLSFWFRTNAPAGSTFNVALGMFGTQAQYLSTITAPPGTWQYQTITVPPPPNGTAFNSGSAGGVSVHIAPYGLVQTGTGWNATGNAFSTQGSYNWPSLAGSYIHCTGIQLEKGTVATPFEARSYATELALCQRYYQQFNCTASGGNYQSFGSGTQQTSTLAYTTLPLIVPMRTNSTLSSNSAPSTFALTQATASTVSSMALTQSSTNQNYMQWTITGGSAGQGVLVVANGTTSAFLGFSAEL